MVKLVRWSKMEDMYIINSALQAIRDKEKLSDTFSKIAGDFEVKFGNKRTKDSINFRWYSKLSKENLETILKVKDNLLKTEIENAIANSKQEKNSVETTIETAVATETETEDETTTATAITTETETETETVTVTEIEIEETINENKKEIPMVNISSDVKNFVENLFAGKIHTNKDDPSLKKYLHVGCSKQSQSSNKEEKTKQKQISNSSNDKLKAAIELLTEIQSEDKNSEKDLIIMNLEKELNYVKDQLIKIKKENNILEKENKTLSEDYNVLVKAMSIARNSLLEEESNKETIGFKMERNGNLIR